MAVNLQDRSMRKARGYRRVRIAPVGAVCALSSACLVAFFSVVLAQNATPNLPAAVPNLTVAPSVTDAAKSWTNSGGRIDGYLAGGRWREGTKLVDVAGQFRLSNERVAFLSPDGKSRFTCLENLNSERVGRIVSESPETLDWIVQGTITEYRSENYLLVTQAVIRPKSAKGSRGTPEQTSTP